MNGNFFRGLGYALAIMIPVWVLFAVAVSCANGSWPL